MTQGPPLWASQLLVKEWLAYYNLYLLDDQNTHGSNKTPPTEIYFGIIASKCSSCSIWGTETNQSRVNSWKYFVAGTGLKFSDAQSWNLGNYQLGKVRLSMFSFGSLYSHHHHSRNSDFGKCSWIFVYFLHELLCVALVDVAAIQTEA